MISTKVSNIPLTQQFEQHVNSLWRKIEVRDICVGFCGELPLLLV
jgi:hypothetical protein